MKTLVLNALVEARAYYVSQKAKTYNLSANNALSAKIARVDEAITAALALEEPEVVEETPTEEPTGE